MYRLDWSIVATNGLLETIRSAAGASGKIDLDPLRTIVATTLSHVGGLPVAKRSWSEYDCDRVGRRLFHEAVGAMLRRGFGLRRPLPGCDLGDAPKGRVLGLERSLVDVAGVDVNAADAATLEALPVLGPALARRTIDERRARGPFRSLEDLADRVNGVGDAGSERLALMLRIARSEQRSPGASVGVYVGDLERDFATLVSLHAGQDADERLRVTLEALVAFCAAEPHPATRLGLIRRELEGERGDAPDTMPVEEVEVLEDERYYFRMREYLSEAQSSIDIAMFFAALPSPDHPTHQLLERVAEAHAKGAQVRVLFDRDREEDPYGSRVINAEAIAFLQERSVPVRVDAEDQLLHSKLVIIDGKVTVVGSHNWTAGSYFRYHDISVALAGEAIASAWRTRFDELWQRGQNPPTADA